MRTPGIAISMLLLLSGSAIPLARPAAAVPAASPVSQNVPRFEPGACPFRPAPGWIEGRTVNCGEVVVLEDHHAPDGPTIRLAVAIFEPAQDDSGAPPALLLSGGPGFPAGAAFFSTATPVLQHRRLVVFDQRGVGDSKPQLVCPEWPALRDASLARQLSHAERLSAALTAVTRCHDRLVAQGINLAAYTSAQSAADVNDILTALGYPTVTLVSFSYGSRLALTVMRDFPGIVASAVLDSPLPLDANWAAEYYLNAQRSFDAFFRGCAAAPACNAAHPDLENAFYRLVDQLNAAPVPIQLKQPLTGTLVDQLLTGDRLVSYVFTALYETRLIPLLPAVIAATGRGDYATLAELFGQLEYGGDDLSVGMTLSVVCGEMAPFSTQASVDAARAQVRPELAAGLEGIVSLPVCTAWDVPPADPIEHQPVQSSIPALVVSGEYDPVVPPAWSKGVASALVNSSLFEFPGTGHVVRGSSPCALSIFVAFLADAGTPPDGSCIARLTGPPWR